MLVVMEKSAKKENIEKVCKIIESMGYKSHKIPGPSRTVVCVTGNDKKIYPEKILTIEGVKEIVHVSKPYKLVSREVKPDDTVIKLKNTSIGSNKISIIAGPCAVESREQIFEIAEELSKRDVKILRGGAYKPRTSPYSFQGLGEKGLEYLALAGEKFNLSIISEVLDTESFPIIENYVDIIQIGSRNMQNFSLLKKAGKSNKPIFLKRGFSSTLNEFLLAAEYIISEGNPNVILCERGIRTFSNETRFTLDISAIPILKKMTHLPIIVDPSHAAGIRDLVEPLSKAGIAAGADGLMIEVHTNPDAALSDSAQTISIESFDKLLSKINVIKTL